MALPDPAAPAVFLDRDGTLMADVEYCGDPASVHVFPESAAALWRLQVRGYKLVMITNQSGIGRGYFAEEDFVKVQTEFFRQMGSAVRFDGVYHCPDHPERATNRRKPGPGMILEAAEELGLDLGSSFFVGDSCADMEAGQRAGVMGTVFVLTGKAPEEHRRCAPNHVAPDLPAAADWIIRKGVL